MVDQLDIAAILSAPDVEAFKGTAQRIPSPHRLLATWDSLIEVAGDDDRASGPQASKYGSQRLAELEVFVPTLSIAAPGADMSGRPRDAHGDDDAWRAARNPRDNESSSRGTRCLDVDSFDRIT